MCNRSVPEGMPHYYVGVQACRLDHTPVGLADSCQMTGLAGDPIGYTVAARRYGVGNRKAKARLIDALNQWPASVDRAYKLWNDQEIQRSGSCALG